MSKRSDSGVGGAFNGFGINVFSNDAMDAIHCASLEILWHEGIKTDCEEAKEVYSAGGCVVDNKKGRVFIPPHVVEAAIDSAPPTALYAAREPENDIIMEGNRVNFCNFSKGVNVIDPYTREYRMSRTKDQIEATVICDYLDEIDLVDVPIECHDLPVCIQNLATYELMMQNTVKHCNTSIHNTEEAEKVIEMAEALAGSKENLRARPRVSTLVCPISPLSISYECAEPIMVFARHRMPCTILSMSMAGGTAPVTLAGTVIVHNCEVLAGIVLGQLTNKGTPNLYGSSTTTMALSKGTAAVGSPELGMLSAAVSRMAKYYKLPCYVAGG